ncbi:MAG: ribose-phosphate diphosphokinase [Candidatus Doudnabacteria bacterium]|nr:ribose-phosphate diphosphokinase [Candidatus Doudnabacteria bacterium]
MAEAVKLISPNFADIFTPNIEIGEFPDGDSHVRIPLIGECKDREVVVFHRLYPRQNTSLVALLLILDSLKEIGAKHVSVVAPYLPYSRQDKKKLNGEVASAYVICNLLARAGCDKLISFDCHFLNKEGPAKFGELNIENISMGKVLVEHAKDAAFLGEGCEVISPDMGANYLVKEHGGKSYKKVRKEYEGDKIHYRDVGEMDGDFDVKGRNVLLLDDMISTGATMIRALEKLTEAGAKKICCAATHGLFLYNCVDKIKKFTDCVYSTDTIVNDNAKVSVKQKLTDFGATQPTLF